MAISLGSAALAFAGGAATQYNKIADEERKAAAKRKERLQELVDQAMVKQEETKYSYEMSEYQKAKALESTLGSIDGGQKSVMGQLAIAEDLGLDRNAFLKSPEWGKLSPKQIDKAPIPYTERMMNYAAGEYDPQRVKFAERYRSKNEGKTFKKDGAGILRGIPTKPDGTADPMDIARGLGLDEDMPAALVGDATAMDDQFWEDARATLLGETAKFEYMNVDGKIVRTDPTGKKPAEVVYESSTPLIQTNIDAKSGNVTSTAVHPETGEIINVSREGDFDANKDRARETDINGNLRFVDDGSLVFPDVAEGKPDRKMEQDPNGILRFVDDGTPVFPDVVAEAKVTDFTTKFDKLTEIVKELQNPGLPAEQRALLEEQRAFIRGNITETADRDRQALFNKERKYQEQFGSLDLGAQAATRLASIVTAEQGGPRALATKIADNIDAYTAGIFGSDQTAQDIINRYSVIDGDPEYTSKKTEEMANSFKQGSVDFLAEAVKWDIADALKRGDKLTTDDLKRVDNMLTAPFGSNRYASQLNEAIHLMEAHKDKQVIGLMVGRGIPRRDIKKISDPEDTTKSIWVWYDPEIKKYNEFLP